MRPILTFAAIVAGAGLLAAGPVLGMDSGGAGGGSMGSAMPSASTPQYDPAAEYAKAVAAVQAKDFKAAARAAEHVTEAAPKDVEWLAASGRGARQPQ